MSVLGGVKFTLRDLEGLSAWQREEVARHFAQTRHMNYGGLERLDSLLFGLAFGDPATIRTEPPAVFLAELVDAVRAGTDVHPPRMSKGDATRMSECLRQSAGRAAREGRDERVSLAMAALCRLWDDAQRVPADEFTRAELAALPPKTRAVL